MFCCLLLGYLLLALIIYIARTWRLFLVATTVTTLPGLVYYFILDESPRWLIANDKREQAYRVLRKIARINRKSLPANLVVTFKSSEQKDTTKYSELFRSKRMIATALIMFFNWWTTAGIYYSLVFFSPKIGGGIYSALIMASVSEILATIYAHFLLNTVLGRKWNTSIAFGLTAVVLACIVFVPRDALWVQLCLVTLGKFGVTANWTFLYIHASELYPTKLRSLFMSMCYSIARIAVVVSPFISKLQSKYPYIVTLCMAGFSFVSAVLCLFLPETRHLNMADTVQESLHYPDVNDNHSAGADRKTKQNNRSKYGRSQPEDDTLL